MMLLTTVRDQISKSRLLQLNRQTYCGNQTCQFRVWYPMLVNFYIEYYSRVNLYIVENLSIFYLLKSDVVRWICILVTFLTEICRNLFRVQIWSDFANGRLEQCPKAKSATWSPPVLQSFMVRQCIIAFCDFSTYFLKLFLRDNLNQEECNLGGQNAAVGMTYQVAAPQRTKSSKLSLTGQCWIRYALKKITGLFGKFSQHRGGWDGLPNSQNLFNNKNSP